MLSYVTSFYPVLPYIILCDAASPYTFLLYLPFCYVKSFYPVLLYLISCYLI